MYRPNLFFAARPVDSEADKEREAAELLLSTEGTSIIYTATVAHAESLTSVLRATGKRVARYHGKVPARERHDTHISRGRQPIARSSSRWSYTVRPRCAGGP